MMSSTARRSIEAQEFPPSETWHSFDRTPWKHPWLTRGNLTAFREFSARVRAEAARVRERIDCRGMTAGFVGNMGNHLYITALPLRRRGLDIEIVLHPHDRYVMSHPCWEEFDGEIPEGPREIGVLREIGIRFPEVAGIWDEPLPASQPAYDEVARYFTRAEYDRHRDCTGYHEILKHLAAKDVLLATQYPYLALLARRPYLVTAMGGDFEFECSRNDALGQLQRRAFRGAAGHLLATPENLAEARRYKLENLFYLPDMRDQSVYSPGEDDFRETWRQRTGGSFFVLSTSRVDDFEKGSQIGLRGFAEFARQCPGARLIVLGYQEQAQRLAELETPELADRLLVLPVVGKRRLVRYLRSADCLIDEFVYGGYGFAALEAMACGLPVIMRLETEMHDALCETGAPPILNADTPDEVTRHLLALANNAEHRRSLAEAHRRWFVANHGDERWAQDYENVLVCSAIGHRFDFRDSPLSLPLSAEERHYQLQQLLNAPQFPNYL